MKANRKKRPAGPRYEDVVIFGLGHIGASLAARLAARGLRVWGWDRDPAAVRFCRNMGWLYHLVPDHLDLEGRAAVCIVALPEAAMDDESFHALLAHLPRQTIVTDVFSSKGRGTALLKRECVRHGLRMAWSHPLAGREGQGAASADPTIFENATVLLDARAAAPVRTALTNFWKSAGCSVEAVSTVAHQKRMARGSHLMHVLAYSLMHTIQDGGTATPSVLGVTRVAKSDPEAWAGILTSNAREVLLAAKALGAQLEHSTRLIERGDLNALKKYLSVGQKARLALESGKKK